MDNGVSAFVAAVREKQKRIVIEVATGHAGEPIGEVTELLRRRLAGTGAADAEIIRWAEAIGDVESGLTQGA